MPHKDGEKRRRYDAAWQREITRSRKVAWLLENPCACGAPATRIFAGPGMTSVPHGIFSYSEARRTPVLAQCVPLCQPCSAGHPRTKPSLDAMNPDRVAVPKVPKPAKPKAPPIPKAPQAKPTAAKPTADIEGDMAAAERRRDRQVVEGSEAGGTGVWVREVAVLTTDRRPLGYFF
jgi:hypothetical protein